MGIGKMRYIKNESTFSVAINSLKHFLYRAATRNASSFFVRSGDKIANEPMVNGTYEPLVTDFINEIAKSGYNKFLLDIGANIGLITCQVGKNFDYVEMFEPNPYCCKLIEVNLVISDLTSGVKINNFGLGEADGFTKLTVPKNNWGGAFVKTDDNAYDNKTLILKDGFSSYNEKNYFNIDIQIKNSNTALTQTFSELSRASRDRGVIKIDVEGFEAVVLGSIAEVLPPEFSGYIIFECWSAEIDAAAIKGAFGGRAEAYKLRRNVPWAKGASKVEKAFKLFWARTITSELQSVDDTAWEGDMVLEIQPAAAK